MASCGLLFLHAMSGCDTVSAFAGIGKKTAFSVWMSQPHLLGLFKHLASAPESVSDDDMCSPERFVVLLYSRTSSCETVNHARKELFACGNRQIANIPPTRSALEQHVKRAVYQLGIYGASPCSQTLNSRAF